MSRCISRFKYILKSMCLCYCAACNVWYLGSVALESLTGHQAVQKATTITLSMDPPQQSTVVHFKVSTQGITLTDNQRKWVFAPVRSQHTYSHDVTRGHMLTPAVFLQVVLQETLRSERCHLLLSGPTGQEVSNVTVATSTQLLLFTVCYITLSLGTV